MPLMFDPSKSRAILIGIGTFLKDDDLYRREHVYKDISLLRDTLTDAQILGLHEKDIISLVDSEGNTMIKERIAEVANTTEDTLILFYSGYLIERRGKLILSSPHTTVKQCHINGIPLTEVVDIINESSAKNAFLVLDAEYRSAPTFGDFDKLSIKTIEDLVPFGPVKTYIVSELGQSDSQKTIASGLTSLLQTGIEEEKEVLTIADIKNNFSNDASLQHVSFVSNDVPDAPICFNKRFSIAQKLRASIKKCFDDKNYAEALPFLKEGIELFEHDEEFNNMAAFVETLQQAEQMYNNQHFEAARNRYQAAYEILKEDTAHKGIVNSLEKIAEEQYTNKNFESSKDTYTQLLEFDTSNKGYQDKVDFCNSELKFTSLIDLGDKAYFDNNFIEAKEHYNKALDFKQDAVVLRRKEECEKFLSREEKLRAEVRDELRKEFEGEFSNKVNDQLKTKEVEIEEQLRDKLKTELSNELLPKAKEEVTLELETSIWQKTAIWNSVEGYQFYQNMFPEGKFVEKSKQRIEQINKQTVVKKLQEEAVPAPVVVERKEIPQEEIDIDPTLLMDLRMEPIEDVLTKIEEAKGLKGEYLLWTDMERMQLDKEIDFDDDEKEETSTVVSEMDSVLEEALREVEEEESEISFETPSEIITSEDSFSLEEAQEITSSAQEFTEVTSDVKDEIVQTTFDTEIEEATSTTNNVSTSEEDLEQLSENDLWLRAEKLNTKDGYLSYINFTKTAEQIAEAYFRINKLDKGEPVEVITQTPSVTEETPVVAEEEVVNVIEEVTTPEPVIEETPAPIAAEEINTPAVDSALVFIDGMNESDLWRIASGLNTIDSYKEYLNRTEENEYLADAYSRINTIQNADEGETITFEDNSTPVVEDTIIEETVVEEETPSTLPDLVEESTTDYTNGHEVQVETIVQTETEFNLEKDVTTEITEEEVVAEETTPIPEVKEELTATAPSIDAEEEALWKSTCEENTLGAYFNYLNSTTSKSYWKEAKENISALKNDSQAKEEDDWKKAQEIDTVEGYKTYIRKYPLGNYYAAAMMRLGKLE
ncbi:hypothetical protein [Flammeovirga kamogawensis]|uniref:Caspase family p20 domain-containing protein n=1 Tax=Flammeovirga kamogawensis TaxID=373891 RepID=A0ABX8GV08_9BACT|nr:hypothetical protein [Flammeovirga kamogawensis]MBB6459750.1 hypothetical protein [Flammeovirga kamogawensis]QWG07191.1 hypothetical protein KM029_18095 [Flammeovirga kamogawensis]TRX69011.1 hypothetical protein EO216_13085 [Flammeovirga kamogawensis]